MMVDNFRTAMWSVMVVVQKFAEFSHLRVLAFEQHRPVRYDPTAMHHCYLIHSCMSFICKLTDRRRVTRDRRLCLSGGRAPRRQIPPRLD